MKTNHFISFSENWRNVISFKSYFCKYFSKITNSQKNWREVLFLISLKRFVIKKRKHGMESGGGLSAGDLSTIGGIATVSLLHSFIPTHWLPFSIVGRAQKWTLSRTLLVSTSFFIFHLLLHISTSHYLLDQFYFIRFIRPLPFLLLLVLQCRLCSLFCSWFNWVYFSYWQDFWHFEFDQFRESGKKEI